MCGPGGLGPRPVRVHVRRAEQVHEGHPVAPARYCRDDHGEREEAVRDRLELFGVKFPSEVVGRWGVIVLLAVQLYFLMHLQEFALCLEPGDAAWNYPWIGTYPASLAKVVFVTSATILPLAAVLIVRAGLGRTLNRRPKPPRPHTASGSPVLRRC